MFTLTRISTVPASPLKVVVAQPDGDEAGLTVGGSFYFQPAGDEHGDDTAGMSEFAARAIMGDPGLAVHFRCAPSLPSLAAPQPEPQAEPPVDTRPSRRRAEPAPAAESQA